ncbi:mannose-6-phosphate isomerase, partial [Mycoplasma marinum]
KPEVGQFINVPAGLVHGIGGGSKVLEVQQPSDTTYRLYDYDRLENGELRELHIEKSLKSIKDLKWEIENKGDNVYITNEYSIEIGYGEKILSIDCIIVDLEEEIAYLAKKDEKIFFQKWAIVKERK